MNASFGHEAAVVQLLEHESNVNLQTEVLYMENKIRFTKQSSSSLLTDCFG